MMEAALRRGETTVGTDDAYLVRQVQSGHTGAFAQLVTRYQDRVHNTCLRICRNREDARDLTQDAFLKAFDAIGTFECKSSFYTWLFRIAVNLSLSHRKKSRLRLVASLDDDGGKRGREGETSAADRVADKRDPGPLAHAETNELRKLVAAAVESLDEHHRVIVVLRDIEGCDYAQISEIMDIPVGTVKSRVHRGRVALREALQRMQNGPRDQSDQCHDTDRSRQTG